MEIELKILDWFQSIRTPLGDTVMVFVTKLGDAGFLWILLAVILILIPKKRKSGILLMLALVVEVILCNGILKPIICRVRPCDVNSAIQLLIPRPQDFSFPSGHTAAAFAAVTALYSAKEKVLWKLTLILAVFIALSRMYLYVHYPTDILGGMLAGVIAGYIGYWLVKRIGKQKRTNVKQDT